MRFLALSSISWNLHRFPGRSPVTTRPSSLHYRGRSPITMRSFSPFSIGQVARYNKTIFLPSPSYFLGRSPITMRPSSSSFIWVGHPLQRDHLHYCHLRRSLVRMRPSLSLSDPGRSPITMRPSSSFFTWVGHPLQWNHFPVSFTNITIFYPFWVSSLGPNS